MTFTAPGWRLRAVAMSIMGVMPPYEQSGIDPFGDWA